MNHLVCSKYFIESFTFNDPHFINDTESQIDLEAYSPQNVPPASTELGLKHRVSLAPKLVKFFVPPQKTMNIMFSQDHEETVFSKAVLGNSGR